MKFILKVSLVTLFLGLSIIALGTSAKAVENTVPQTTVPTTTHKPETKIKVGAAKLSVKKSYEKNVKLNWKAGKNAKSYMVYRAPKGSSFSEIATTNKTSFKDKKANKRTTYSYKIVAFAKKNGKTFVSKDSNVKTIYVRPKTPKVVICGECFVEGMKLYANKYRPKNSSFVYKIGISTYGLLNTNYIKYKGMTLTATERIAYYKPDRVYFLVGMNEAVNKSPSVTVKNYAKVFKLLKKVNPNIEMVLMALPPVGRNHAKGFASNSGINRYNRAYSKYAKKTKNVFYYSSYRKLITNGSGYLKGSANGGDGGHWSARSTVKVVKDLKKHSKKLTKR